MEERIYTVTIEPCEEGGYWAYVPALPGCVTQGETLSEVVRMAEEAIKGFIKLLAHQGKPIPVEKPSERPLSFGIKVAMPAKA